jgi:hypothetical protein
MLSVGRLHNVASTSRLVRSARCECSGGLRILSETGDVALGASMVHVSLGMGFRLLSCGRAYLSAKIWLQLTRSPLLVDVDGG